MLIAAGVLSLSIWVYLVLARGGFWRIHPAASPQETLENTNPVRIAVIIPARNEADVVGRAIRSLLPQTGGNKIHIFLVDDASNDGTAQATRSAAMAESQGQNLTVAQESTACRLVRQAWAMQQGVEHAPTPRRTSILFTDADIERANSVATLVSIAQTGPI